MDAEVITSLREQFAKEDQRYKTGRNSYDLMRNNCSSLIAASLGKVGLIFPAPLNIIPVLFFKRFILNNLGTEKFAVGKISAFDESAFTLHRYCFGMRGMNPQDIMDRWMMRLRDRSIKTWGLRPVHLENPQNAHNKFWLETK